MGDEYGGRAARGELNMSLDRSLKTSGNLKGKRNVMTRAERIEVLKKDKKFDPKKDSALGLRKTRVVE
ncbi:MAG TPA: small basic protein [Phycisphaerales bacterium]|nr:small basic protein [Phycisphaerales bacterium]